MNIPDLSKGLPPCAGKKGCEGKAVVYLPVRQGFVCAACLQAWNEAKANAARKVADEAFPC